MEVRLCKKEDIPNLVDFIKRFWNPNHVFVKRPEVLLWQYQNETNGLNFYIAIDKNDIHAILGFIPLSHFDKSLSNKREAWGALWKVRPDCKIPGLGTYLQKKATREFEFFGGIGVSQDNINIQNALKNKVVHINHFYVLNQNIDNYLIASVSEKKRNSFEEKSINFDLYETDSIDGIPEVSHVYRPYKTNQFMINRYQRNPFYNYRYLICKNSNLIKAVLVIKYVTVGERKACRVVDVLGDLTPLNGLGKAIEAHISQYADVEYVDFYNSGLSKEYFVNNGFLEVDDFRDDIIIPNYFEPFVKKNCPLDGIIISDVSENYSFFKGDADQDRPNF